MATIAVRKHLQLTARGRAIGLALARWCSIILRRCLSDDESADELLARADAAMYRAKRCRGRPSVPSSEPRALES